MSNAQSFLKSNVILNPTMELLSAQYHTVGVDCVSSKLWRKVSIYLTYDKVKERMSHGHCQIKKLILELLNCCSASKGIEESVG